MNALQHWIDNRSIDTSAAFPQAGVDEAAAAFSAAHECVSYYQQEPSVIALQVLAGIDDNTFCGIADAVAKYAQQVTDPDRFERVGKMLDACNAMACVFAGMGSN